MGNVFFAKCSRCRIAFRAPRMIAVASSPAVRVENAGVPCPQCGETCPLGDPRREVAADGSVRYFVGDEPTDREVADALIADIRAAQSAEEAARILEERAPWLAPLAAWLRENSAYAGWLGLVLTVLFHFFPSPSADETPAQPTPAQIEETLKEIVKELREELPTRPEPPGTPSPPAPAAPGPTTPATAPDPGSLSPPGGRP